MARRILAPVTISVLHLPLGGLSAASTSTKRSAQLVNSVNFDKPLPVIRRWFNPSSLPSRSPSCTSL